MKRILAATLAILMCSVTLFTGCKKNVESDLSGGGKHTSDDDFENEDEYFYGDDDEIEKIEKNTTQQQPISETTTVSTSTDTGTTAADTVTDTTAAAVTEAPVETTTSAPETTAAPTTLPATDNKGTKSLGKSSKGYSIEMKDGIVYVGGIMIANKTYSLPKDYYPGDLTAECDAAYTKMKSAAAKDGIGLWIVSGFRSYDTQASLYNRYSASDGQAAADTYSARPGHSEHQTGLAMDINSLESSFANTPEGKWLAANAWKYGFILRYPSGKESVTGYIYEPWHYRYVGEELAKSVYDSGLCLEEYLGITSVYA